MELPIIIEKAQSKVTIYPIKNRNTVTHMLVWYSGGKRNRRGIADRKTAVQTANSIVESLAEGRGKMTEITIQELQYYQDCEAKLGGIPLIKAVDFYLAHNGSSTQKPMTLEKVVDEFILWNKNRNISERQRRTYRHHLHNLRDSMGTVMIERIRSVDIDKYLNQSRWSDRTRKNHQASIIQLFKYAKRTGYLPRDLTSEAENAQPINVIKTDKEVWSVSELRQVLNAATWNVLPFIAITAFSGIRAAELARLEWSDIQWDEGVIHLSKSVTKTQNARLAPLTENLKAWLQPYRNLEGSIFKSLRISHNPYRALGEMAREKNITWKPNASRHSFATYYLALTQDPAKTSLACGHSMNMLMNTYKTVYVNGKPVTKELAESYFSLMPVT